MNTIEQLKENLLQFPRRTIALDELAEISPNSETYDRFATDIKTLEDEQILQMVRARGRNRRKPSLAYHYRIRKGPLNKTYYEILQKYRYKLHNTINLDAYFSLDLQTWKKDLPYIEQINHYIEQHGFPKDYAPAPERSFALVGNEKWIEQVGEELLHRIKLWDALKIMPVADPLMFAINPNKINSQTANHLIVENKTTYEALLPVLTDSSFATLIYGAGNKIEKSIENFANQYPTSSNQRFFYFGDIDRAGISIWHRLTKKRHAIPALPFYEACLEKERVYGKINQQKSEQALKQFVSFFKPKDRQAIKDLIEDGAYYPQEVLKTKTLQQIFLQANWDQVHEGI